MTENKPSVLGRMVENKCHYHYVKAVVNHLVHYPYHIRVCNRMDNGQILFITLVKLIITVTNNRNCNYFQNNSSNRPFACPQHPFNVLDFLE